MFYLNLPDSEDYDKYFYREPPEMSEKEEKTQNLSDNATSVYEILLNERKQVSIKTLSKLTNLNENMVKKAIKELEKLGLVDGNAGNFKAL